MIGGGFAGKYNYVSPEQLGLYGGEVTGRSDIYSLGLVIVQCLRGKPIDMGGKYADFETPAYHAFADGLTEATTFGGGMLGIDGVRALIRDHAEETPDLRLKSIAGAVKLPGQSLRDDLTLLVVEDMGIAPIGARPPIDNKLSVEDGQIMRIRVPARPDRLKLIRAATEQASKYCDAPEPWTFDLMPQLQTDTELLEWVCEKNDDILRHMVGPQ